MKLNRILNKFKKNLYEPDQIPIQNNLFQHEFPLY